MSIKHCFCCTLLVLCVPVILCAGDITYDVNLTIGAGSVTGDIVTDGAIGDLTSTDIVDWNLIVNDGVSSSDLTGPLSGDDSSFVDESGPGDLTATASELLFNYSDISTKNFAGFSDNAYPDYFWIFCGTTPYCTGNAPEDVGEVTISQQVTVTTASVTGTQPIAEAVASPEPLTVVLFGVGLTLLVPLRRPHRI